MKRHVRTRIEIKPALECKQLNRPYKEQSEARDLIRSLKERDVNGAHDET